MKTTKGDVDMDTLIIKELESTSELLAAFPIMKQLRTHLDETAYPNLVKEAQEKDSYRMLALQDGSDIVSVIGFKPMITLYYGRFVWVCDLVTDQNRRSGGYGQKLLDYVHDWAKENSYTSVALSSGLQREDAHRFYEEKMEYDRVSYLFRKVLD